MDLKALSDHQLSLCLVISHLFLEDLNIVMRFNLQAEVKREFVFFYLF